MCSYRQSSEMYWEQFSVETLDECERTRQKSVMLRGTLDAILTNAARDLRSQADRVEQALSARIACMDEIRVKLENDLNDVVFQKYYFILVLRINNQFLLVPASPGRNRAAH